MQFNPSCLPNQSQTIQGDTLWLKQQLLGLTLQYLSDQEGNENLVLQAGRIGEKYGGMALDMGLPLTKVLQVVLIFHDSMVETAFCLPESVQIKPETSICLVRRINKLLDTVQFSIATVYENNMPKSD